MKRFGELVKRIFDWKLLKRTFQEWSNDKASRLAAALAFYSATAFAPLIIGVLAIAGLIFDTEQAQAQLIAQVSSVVGAQGAEIVQTILSNADRPELARFAGLLSLATFLWSASNIFVQLQDSIDTVWGVQLRPDLPFMAKVRDRLMPLVAVVGVGLLLMVAIVANTVLSAIGSLASDLIPGGAFVWQIVSFFISLAIITLLFGLVFKILPHVKIAWDDVWPGAALTALLFVVGQFLLSWYLGRQSGASLYGAAGSLIIFLFWLYYSAQIFLFGAEFTQVYATRYGAGVLPADNAVARSEVAAEKPAAEAAKRGETTPRHAHDERPPRSRALPRREATALAQLPFTQLARETVAEGGAFFEMHLALAKQEISETARRAASALGLTVGGALVVYAGMILIFFFLAFLLNLLMPLWVALFLVGLLGLIEGWMLIVWARHKLRAIATVPKRSAARVRQDVEVVKAHLTS